MLADNSRYIELAYTYLDCLASILTYLTPKIVCNSVAMPDTKNIVEIKLLVANGLLLPIQSGAASTNGKEIVPPNIVK